MTRAGSVKTLECFKGAECWCASQSAQSVHRLVEDLSVEQPTFELLPQQAALPLGSLHEATVLQGTARQVGDDLVDWAVGDVLVHWESSLAYSQRRRGSVKHVT